MGDFSATLDHAPMRELLEAGLTDAAEDAGSGCSRPGRDTDHVALVVRIGQR